MEEVELVYCKVIECVVDIGVGAQSTLGGHKIFVRKICIKNQQNARILHDYCSKNHQNTLIYMITQGNHAMQRRSQGQGSRCSQTAC